MLEVYIKIYWKWFYKRGSIISILKITKSSNMSRTESASEVRDLMRYLCDYVSKFHKTIYFKELTSTLFGSNCI